MNVLTLPRKVATVEYSALRLPLTVLHRGLTRLDDESPVRLSFERGLGSLDATVGRVLGSPELTRRGATLTRKAEVLEKAVALETKAAERKQQANAELQQSKQTAERKRVAATKQAQDEARSLHEQQQAERRAAEQQAQAEAKARTAAAEREAQAKIDAAERDADEKVSTIEQRTQARTAKPKAQLKDAASLASEAERERVTAERMAELADAEKASRRSG